MGRVRARLLAGDTAEIADSSVAVEVVLARAEILTQLPDQLGDYGFLDGDVGPRGVEVFESVKSGGETFS